MTTRNVPFNPHKKKQAPIGSNRRPQPNTYHQYTNFNPNDTDQIMQQWQQQQQQQQQHNQSLPAKPKTNNNFVPHHQRSRSQPGTHDDLIASTLYVEQDESDEVSQLSIFTFGTEKYSYYSGNNQQHHGPTTEEYMHHSYTAGNIDGYHHITPVRNKGPSLNTAPKAKKQPWNQQVFCPGKKGGPSSEEATKALTKVTEEIMSPGTIVTKSNYPAAAAAENDAKPSPVIVEAPNPMEQQAAASSKYAREYKQEIQKNRPAIMSKEQDTVELKPNSEPSSLTGEEEQNLLLEAPRPDSKSRRLKVLAEPELVQKASFAPVREPSAEKDAKFLSNEVDSLLAHKKKKKNTNVVVAADMTAEELQGLVAEDDSFYAKTEIDSVLLYKKNNHDDEMPQGLIDKNMDLPNVSRRISTGERPLDGPRVRVASVQEACRKVQSSLAQQGANPNLAVREPGRSNQDETAALIIGNTIPASTTLNDGIIRPNHPISGRGVANDVSFSPLVQQQGKGPNVSKVNLSQSDVSLPSVREPGQSSQVTAPPGNNNVDNNNPLVLPTDAGVSKELLPSGDEAQTPFQHEPVYGRRPANQALISNDPTTNEDNNRPEPLQVDKGASMRLTQRRSVIGDLDSVTYSIIGHGDAARIVPLGTAQISGMSGESGIRRSLTRHMESSLSFGKSLVLDSFKHLDHQQGDDEEGDDGRGGGHKQWTCRDCSYANTQMYDSCAICGGSNKVEPPRPTISRMVSSRRVLRSSVVLNNAAQTDGGGEGRPWMCQVCTYMNTNPLHLSCEVCGEPRSNNAKPEALNEPALNEEEQGLVDELSNKVTVKERFLELLAEQADIIAELKAMKAYTNSNDHDANERFRRAVQIKGPQLDKIREELAAGVEREQQEQEMMEQSQNNRLTSILDATGAFSIEMVVQNDNVMDADTPSSEALEWMAQQRMLDDWRSQVEARALQLEEMRLHQLEALNMNQGA